MDPSSAFWSGAYPRATGCLQVYELDGTEAKLTKEKETKASVKAGVRRERLSRAPPRHQLRGTSSGSRARTPRDGRQGATSIVNTIDGCGGQAKGYEPELVTCGRDGAVRVWDVRQRDAPVAAFEPATA